MNHLLKLIRSAEPGAGVQFRQRPYGRDDVRRFLRDVIAMANAPVEGVRYIVVGIGINGSGRREICPVDAGDFSGNPDYRSLVTEYVEPMVNLQYRSVDSDGVRLGVFEISGCEDKPYMMRADLNERLRRGDAYMRLEKMPVKMGRRQLQSLFEKKFAESVPGDHIEIGFPGEIIHKEMRINTVDPDAMPSAVASQKIREMMTVHTNPANRGATTVIARMLYARLFGSDDPYEDRSEEELQQELDEIQSKYADEDAHYMFESNIETLNLLVLNQGEEAIEDATLNLVMPHHDAFHVARNLPKQRRDGKFVERSEAELSDYPAVSLCDGAITVSSALGNIAPESPKLAFTIPLRICVSNELAGRKLAIDYLLDGRNLRRPASGQLKLLF